MAISAKWYGPALLGQYSSTAARRVDWAADTIKVMLASSAYAPDQDVHTFKSDVTNEVAGSGYSSGGVALTTIAPAYNALTNTLRLDASDAQWSGASFTVRYAIIYKDTGTASTSPLLGYVDFGADQTVVSGTFTIQWDNTDGVLRIVAS